MSNEIEFTWAKLQDVKAIHDLIPGARLDKSLEPEAWTMPCNTTASVSLVFGGRSFAMDPRDLTYLPTNTTGICMSSIAKGGVSPTHWLVSESTFCHGVAEIEILGRRRVPQEHCVEVGQSTFVFIGFAADPFCTSTDEGKDVISIAGLAKGI